MSDVFHIKTRTPGESARAWCFICPGGRLNRLRVHASRISSLADAREAAKLLSAGCAKAGQAAEFRIVDAAGRTIPLAEG
jgi:hypothetical protein